MSSMTQKVLLGTAAAAIAASGSAALGAYYVENMTTPPKFTLTGDRFDNSSFTGRYYKMLSNGDPATLFYSDAEVKKQYELLKSYKQHPELCLKSCKEADLWKARKITEACMHPDTKEIIPRPFRMSGYVPFNGPVCAAMMVSTSTPALLFWNWVNQSQNALVNYYNRNASSETSNETLAISYTAAVSAAMTVAFGLSQTIKRFNVGNPARAAQLLKFVAFPSSMIASCANCYIMRRPEIQTGIEVLNEDLQPIVSKDKLPVKSQAAAKKAVKETVISRSLLQLPVFFGPPVLMSLPPFSTLAVNVPVLAVPVMTLVTMVCFGYGLPATIAVFPNIGSISVNDLEPNVKEAVGAGVSTLLYNKGL